jgi:hypothetical protein
MTFDEAMDVLSRLKKSVESATEEQKSYAVTRFIAKHGIDKTHELLRYIGLEKLIDMKEIKPTEENNEY